MKNSLLLALFTIICFPVFIAAHTFDDPVVEASIEYTNLIVDSNNDRCFDSGIIYNDCVPIDNSCRIENIEVLSTSCNINGSFDMEVDYDYQNEPNYYVDVLLNGEHHSVHGINEKVNLKFIP